MNIFCLVVSDQTVFYKIYLVVTIVLPFSRLFCDSIFLPVYKFYPIKSVRIAHFLCNLCHLRYLKLSAKLKNIPEINRILSTELIIVNYWFSK